MIKAMTSASYTVDDLDTSVRFCFRSRDRDLGTVFFVLYVGAFSACLFLIAVSVFTAKPSMSQSVSDLPTYPIFLVWLLLFLLILLYMLISTWIEIFWRIFGKEIVDIKEDHISIRHQILMIRITKTFRTPGSTCIALSHYQEDESIVALLISLKDRRLSSFERGKLAFNYGKTYAGRTNFVRFGPNLEREEAIEVADIIHRKFPRYKCTAKSAG